MKKTSKILGVALLFGLVSLGFHSEAKGAPAQEWVPSSFENSPNGVFPSGRSRTALPNILSAANNASYGTLFKLQDKGQWKAADRIIKQIRDETLMADVLSQRYLSSLGYRATSTELNDWMDRYADHPDAPEIYALAVKRAGANASSVTRPDGGSVFVGSSLSAPLSNLRKSSSTGQRHLADDFKTHFRAALRRGDTKAARGMLETGEANNLLNRTEHDRLHSELSFSYFVDGMDNLDQASVKVKSARSASDASLNLWKAGLAAWQGGRMGVARGHFESLARDPNASSWLQAAGGYWAARANLKLQRPQAVNKWLALAAASPRTFYGLLARRSLGIHTRFDWDDSEMGTADADLLLESTTGRRVIALVQSGQKERAEHQLRQIFRTSSDDEARAVVALAQKANMASLALSLGDTGNGVEANDTNDAARFPVPSWRPDGGWRIDQALVLALVRQESKFVPDAKGPSGARGLMQLLPSTAAYVARTTGLKSHGKTALDSPETNLMLGQRYVERLLQDPAINGNLLLMAAAYNAGPGNLAKWQAATDDTSDPLLFLETIPMPDTRMFVERVITNFWMYSLRFNQPTPSLDALASGDWPLYVQLDDYSHKVAENVPH